MNWFDNCADCFSPDDDESSHWIQTGRLFHQKKHSCHHCQLLALGGEDENNDSIKKVDGVFGLGFLEGVRSVLCCQAKGPKASGGVAVALSVARRWVSQALTENWVLLFF